MLNHQRTPNLTNRIQVCLAPILDLLLKHAVAVSCRAALATLRLSCRFRRKPRRPHHGDTLYTVKTTTLAPKTSMFKERIHENHLYESIQNYEDVKEREN